MSEVDVVVLGLGIHGSASAYELATRGMRVIAVDQFERGHARGSSHGATRMIRRAYPSPVWNEFVGHAYRGWERWERRLERCLVHRTGGVYAHRDGEQGLRGGRTRRISPEDIAAVMPSLAVPGGYESVIDPDAGVVDAAAALAAAQDGAIAAGAKLSWGESVTGWSAEGGSVRVTTNRRTITADRLVLAGGPWAAALLPPVAEFFSVQRIVTLSARPGQAVGRAAALGAFSIGVDAGLVFGLPESGDAGAKVGLEPGMEWDPGVPPAPPTSAEIEQLADLFRALVPGIDLTGAEASACLYTMTPDKRFVIGVHPGQPEVVIAAACSGHGFKFGPAVGEAVADLVEYIERPDLDFLTPARMWEPAPQPGARRSVSR